MTEAGKMIALQDEDGKVYIGYVTAVRGKLLDVDLIADNSWRGSNTPLGASW